MNDLISRSAAINAVEESRRLNHHTDRKAACDHENEHRHFLNILNGLPPADRWTPVTEGLPKKDGWCLVTTYSSRGELIVSIASYHSIPKIFEDFGDNTLDVIAWMPYPEPYKKDTPASNDDDAAHYLLKKHSEMALKELDGAARLFESLHKHSNN